jgi:hypothetical protein
MGGKKMQKLLGSKTIEVYSEDDYQNMVAVALFAIEHGFKVEFIGLGDLLVQHISNGNK